MVGSKLLLLNRALTFTHYTFNGWVKGTQAAADVMTFRVKLRVLLHHDTGYLV